MKIFRKRSYRLHSNLRGSRVRRGRGYTLPRTIAGLLIIALLGILIFVRTPASSFIWEILSPLSSIGKGVAQGSQYLLLPFTSKAALQSENNALKAALAESEATAADRMALNEENSELKAALGHTKIEVKKTVADIVARPPQLPYDILLLNAGSSSGLFSGDIVGYGATALGTLSEVSAHSSRVTLFSAPGVETRVLISTIPVTLEGEGGGSFAALVPQKTAVTIGDPAVLSGTNRVIAEIRSIGTEEGSAFETLHLSLQQNIFSLPHVEIWQEQLPTTIHIETATTTYR